MKMLSNSCQKVSLWFSMAFLTLSAGAYAQIPSSVPAEVQTAIDDGSGLVVNIGMAMLVFLIIVTVVRWVRGAAS